MRGGSDDERLDVWFTLMRAHAAVSEALTEDLEGSRNMPLSWYEVLIGLAQEPDGRRRMQDLANFALLSKSGLSRLVDRMEEADLVRRESCPSDRRGTFAVLTSRGASALEAATPVFLDGFERHVARHLSDADVRALQTALGKVLEAHGRPASLECRSSLATPSSVHDEEHGRADRAAPASRG
jgi:DNA-binding MarR family transcriptional regulator